MTPDALTDDEYNNLLETGDLREYLRITECLLESHESVTKSVPPCPAHGETCTAHAREWIENAKKRENNQENL